MLKLPGFKYQTPDDYLGSGPKFDLRRHLSGAFISEGMIYGPTGRVVSRFVADMHGHWEGANGSLKENFTYASGLKQNREWILTESNDGTVVANAEDLVGAGYGRAEGCAFRMTYKIRLPADAGGHVLSVVDWMYLVDNGTILNRSQMRKFGIKVAELIATIRPAEGNRLAA
jgi:hypothetical protein